jgi:hypothetical protein
MNNPPAFPNDAVKDPFDKAGMTLRDYFAAKAMQAYLNDDSLEELYVTLNKDVKQELSKNAYKMADAMMKAREA